METVMGDDGGMGRMPMPHDDARSSRIAAKSIHRLLRGAGLDSRRILAVATELLALVGKELELARRKAK